MNSFPWPLIWVRVLKVMAQEAFTSKCKVMAVDSRTMALISYVNSYLRNEGQKENSKEFPLLQQVGKFQHFPSSWDHQHGAGQL